MNLYFCEAPSVKKCWLKNLVSFEFTILNLKFILNLLTLNLLLLLSFLVTDEVDIFIKYIVY